MNTSLSKIFGIVLIIDWIAVVCDQDWIHALAEIGGKLIYSLEMKSFDLDEEDEALDCLGA